MTAAKAAIESPLLEVSINGARGILFNITGGQDMTMSEVNEAAQIISQAADSDANIIFGAAIDDSMGDEIKISVIATGFDENYGAAKLYGNSLTRTLTMSPITPSPQPIQANDSSSAQPQPPASTNQAAPTDNTNQFTVTTPSQPADNKSSEPVEDEFDIPAFLRRR